MENKNRERDGGIIAGGLHVQNIHRCIQCAFAVKLAKGPLPALRRIIEIQMKWIYLRHKKCMCALLAEVETGQARKSGKRRGRTK